MSDGIRDLDDVEAHVWAVAFAAGVGWMDSYPFRPAVFADECIRLLRERRVANPWREDLQIAEMAVDREREKIVAWLRAESERLDGLADALEGSGEQAPAERFCAFRLRAAAFAVDHGEHDR